MGVQRYVYTRFNKISYSKVKDFNIYGIITNVKYESSNDETGKSQDEYRLKVNDGTQDDDINVTAYCTLDEIPNDVFQRGRIVRFHRLTKNYFKNKQDGFYLCGRIGNTTSVLLFDVPPPGAKIRFNPCFRSAVMYSQSTKDEEFLTELIANANKILDKSGTVATQNEASTSGSASQLSLSPAVQFIAPQVSMNGSIVIPVNAPRFANSPVRQTVHQPLPPPPASTVPRHVLRPANKFMTKTPATETVFKKMDELIYGNSCYYNVLFQIVSCYKNGKGNIVLRVWDGLQNPNQLFISPSYDIRLIYGDLKRERLIAEQKKLYDVVCYDEHGRSAAGLKAGDYIALINVHFYSQYPGFLPALIMHKGAGKRGNSVAGRRIIKLTKETTANYFDIIDGLIKEHERSLSTVEENQINNIAQPLPPKSLPLRSSLVEEYDSDDSFYDDSLFQTVETNQVTVPDTSLKSTNSSALANIAADTISTIPDVAPSSTRNDTLITIAPTTSQPTTAAVAPVLTITTPHVVSIPAISQCSTITLSSDGGSTQSSCIIISQRSPEKNNETITLSSTPATPIPISSRSTALQNNATMLPIPTVSNISPTLNIPLPSAIRRSATVAFPQTHNPEPPSKRLCLCGLTNDNEEEESSTQALFDKLQDIENDGDYLNETTLSLTEEQKKINAITDTQLERMWEEVENAQLQPSQSISQWGTWNR